MASALAAAPLSAVLPKHLLAATYPVPGPLELIASRDTCRDARLHAQLLPCNRSALHVARACVEGPDDAAVRAAYEHGVRQDFLAGRVVVVRGWVVAETELALLSMIER
jgi:hypothetical protein